jgi:hypothetical protein
MGPPALAALSHHLQVSRVNGAAAGEATDFAGASIFIDPF